MPKNKVTEDDVRTMRRKYLNREATQNSLAAEYGLTQAAVSMIVNKRTWKLVDPHLGLPPSHFTEEDHRTQAKLNEASVIAIRNAYWEGKATVSQIADLFDMSCSGIYKVINGDSWSNINPKQIKRVRRTVSVNTRN